MAGLAFREAVRRPCAENPVSVAGQVVRCNVSGGVAVWSESGPTVNDLFRAADVALYAAKRAGRDQVHLATPLPA